MPHPARSSSTQEPERPALFNLRPATPPTRPRPPPPPHHRRPPVMCSGMPRPQSSCASSWLKLLQLLWNREYASGVKRSLSSASSSARSSSVISVRLQAGQHSRTEGHVVSVKQEERAGSCGLLRSSFMTEQGLLQKDEVVLVPRAECTTAAGRVGPLGSSTSMGWPNGVEPARATLMPPPK